MTVELDSSSISDADLTDVRLLTRLSSSVSKISVYFPRDATSTRRVARRGIDASFYLIVEIARGPSFIVAAVSRSSIPFERRSIINRSSRLIPFHSGYCVARVFPS